VHHEFDLADGLASIRDAVVAHVNSLGVGVDVAPAGIFAAAVRAVPQIADLLDLKIDIIDPPVATGTLELGIRETAQTGASKVVVS
jgi:hypothetical protein